MISLFTLWVALQEDPSAWWMVECIDEFSWEGNPDQCDQKIAAHKAQADKDGHVWREITINIPMKAIDDAFAPVVIEGVVG